MAYDEVYFHVKSLARKMKIDQLSMAYAFRCLTDATLAMGVSYHISSCWATQAWNWTFWWDSMA